jgi:predicted phage terminase large subunit-like protein
VSAVDYSAALSTVARDELARRHLGDFIELLEPSYERVRHTTAICEYLEAVELGEIDRLMIFMPPRCGKTMHVSCALPAWVLGRNSRAQIILASYGAELAEGNSRKARAYMRSDRWPFECKVSEESRAQNRWHTDAGGVLIATGCQGGLTGYGADRLIIDDPIRDRAEAESESMRESLWAWYSDVARTRLMPNGRIILCETRWHDDDLAGRILNSDDANRWTVLSLPAIAEENDTLGRKPGEALWPERFPVDALPSVERGEMSSSSFAALYQQNPVPASGSTFQLSWTENRYDTLPTASVSFRNDLPVRFGFGANSMAGEERMPLVVVQAIDCAAKTGIANDRTAIATIVSDCRDFFIADVWVGRVSYPDLRRVAVDKFEQHRPRTVGIESASNGLALIDDLRASTSLPIIPLTATDSKIARATTVTGLFEAGRVKFPTRSPWVDEAISELLRFPVGAHDDIVDAIVWALLMAQRAVNQVLVTNIQLPSNLIGRMAR